MRLAALAMLLAVGCAGCATGFTKDASLVAHDRARVEGGVVTDDGSEVEWWVEYGRTRAYGLETEHGHTAGIPPNTPRDLGVELLGLERATTYHYRFCAQDGTQEGGPGCGVDRTVKTQSFACGETVTTSVRFTGNVQCFTQNEPGIVVGASGIEIDMHGFELRAGTFAFDSGAGIDNSEGFSDVTVRDGFITGAPPRGVFAPGIRLDDASRNRILNVRIFAASDGIEIRGGEDNEVRHADLQAFSGVRAEDTNGLIVADSAVKALADGIRLSNVSDGRVVRNQVPSQATWPDQVHFGIYVAGNGNVIKQNRVSGWVGTNISLASGASNKLLENEAFDAHPPIDQPAQLAYFSDGIFVGAFTAGTVVRGNSAHDNSLDGIEVQGVDSRVGDNVANDNGDFGIEAVPGVTDTGGNMASGNHNPLQCSNVFCQ